MNCDEVNSEQLIGCEENLNSVCPELEECLSKLKETSLKENEIRKIQTSALLKIKNIYKETFGSNDILEENMNFKIEEITNKKHHSEQKYQEFYLQNQNCPSLQYLKSNCEDLCLLKKLQNEFRDVSSSKNGLTDKFKPPYVETVLDNLRRDRTGDGRSDFCDAHETNGRLGSEDDNIMRLYELKKSLERLDKFDKELTEKINQTFKNQAHLSNSLEVNDDDFVKFCELKKSIEKLDNYDKELTKRIKQTLKNKEFPLKDDDLTKIKCEKKGSWETVTVPRPFQLTPTRKKEKLEVSEKLVTKFHANPIPENIYKPSYKEIVEKREAKRKERKEQRNQKLKAMVKPFNLSATEYEKCREESQSTPNFLDGISSKVSFKANPVPQFVYNKTLSEKMKEENAERSARIKRRALKMLDQSSLPFSTRNCNITRRSQSCSDLGMIKVDETSDRQIKYSDIFKEKTTTVCQPFHFKTAERFAEKVRKTKDRKFVSCVACTPQKNFKSFSPKPLNPSTSYPLPKKTLTTILRDLYIRKQIEIKRNEMENEFQKLREKLQKEQYFFKEYGWKLKMLDTVPDTKKDIEDKIRSNRKSALQRQCEYKMELKKMQERVRDRPLLVEMQTIISKQNQLEKCYQLALQRAGIDENFINELNEKYKDWETSDLEPDGSAADATDQDDTSACSNAILEESDDQNSRASLTSRESPSKESVINNED
ncbi:protein FAM161B-like [Centruroides sculpturatus]|uniref:protein FAM161B-like n=1 Tax=Centruroides sculpturatus TaxID=218467 RepID=UPI000C6ED521|nr:protein FAM161B-like [Centruroides sculpturatus]XP_023244208.1 protein FAM161B-like [Centruroides sculpturatus]